MASVYHLLDSILPVQNELRDRNAYKDSRALLEFTAARRIQTFWRGHNIRQRVEHWHYSATVIQRNWRGFIGRRIYRAMLEEAVIEMCNAHYFKMATRIQALWRGFRFRKYVFSYYAMKRWIEEVNAKNEALKAAVEEQKEMAREEILDEMEKEAEKWVMFIAFKLHHLLRTEHIAGIYSLKYTTELSKFEKLLKRIKYTKYMTLLRDKYYKLIKQKDATPHFHLQCHAKCHRAEEIYKKRNIFSKKCAWTPEQVEYEKYPNELHPKRFDLGSQVKTKAYEANMNDWPYVPPITCVTRSEDRVLDYDGMFDITHRMDLDLLDYVDYHINELANRPCSAHGDNIEY